MKTTEQKLPINTYSPLNSWAAGTSSGQSRWKIGTSWADNGGEAFEFLGLFGSFCFKTKTSKEKTQQNFTKCNHISDTLSIDLGSSSFITDLSGSAVQHLQPACRRGRYMPLRYTQDIAFGEHFVNQTSTSWETPYTFSGKEKDGEIKPLGADSLNTFKNKQDMRQTGYSYFGARYYDSEISIWLSVDPLSDMYPSTSLFMYVRGNPVILIDPNGMNDDWYERIYKDGEKSVFHRDGDAETVTENGDTYQNIGKIYTQEQGGMNYHYVQNELVAISGNNISFGEALQNESIYKNAISVARSYSYETESAVYMKSFYQGYSDMSQGALALTFAPIIAILGGEFINGSAIPAVSSSILSAEFFTGNIAGAKCFLDLSGVWLTNSAGGEIAISFFVSQMPQSYMTAYKTNAVVENGFKFSHEVYKNISIQKKTMTTEEFMNSHDWSKYGSGTR